MLCQRRLLGRLPIAHYNLSPPPFHLMEEQHGSMLQGQSPEGGECSNGQRLGVYPVRSRRPDHPRNVPCAFFKRAVQACHARSRAHDRNTKAGHQIPALAMAPAIRVSRKTALFRFFCVLGTCRSDPAKYAGVLSIRPFSLRHMLNPFGPWFSA